MFRQILINFVVCLSLCASAFAQLPPGESIPFSQPSQAVEPPEQIEVVSAVEKAAPEKQVLTVDFKDVPVADVLRALSLQQGVNILLDPAVSGNVTIHLSDVTFEQALKFILRSVDADFIREADNVYRVVGAGEVKEKLDFVVNYKLDINNNKMTLHADDVDIRILLQDIAVKSGMSIVFDRDISGKISIHLNDADVREGLILLVENCGCYWEEIDGVFRVSADNNKKYTIDINEDKISVDSSKGDLKNILRDLSLATKVGIVHCGDVAGEVNCTIKEKDVETVIKLILIGTGYEYRKVIMFLLLVK
ncbi:hypothetical protein KKC59_00330, partial [bacterium]|nr:hypothetical protein [bacterium]